MGDRQKVGEGAGIVKAQAQALHRIKVWCEGNMLDLETLLATNLDDDLALAELLPDYEDAVARLREEADAIAEVAAQADNDGAETADDVQGNDG